MIRLQCATTAREQMLDITGRIQRAVDDSRMRCGACVVYVPHTTAAVTINENADPAVVEDMLAHMATCVPRQAGFRHAEGNADAHIKASLFGSSATVIVEHGRLQLGTWQSVFLCEFDGPRTRSLWVQCVAAAAENANV